MMKRQGRHPIFISKIFWLSFLGISFAQRVALYSSFRLLMLVVLAFSCDCAGASHFESQKEFLGSVPVNTAFTFYQFTEAGKREDLIFQSTYSTDGFFITTKKSRYDTNDYTGKNLSTLLYAGGTAENFWRVSNDELATWRLGESDKMIPLLNGTQISDPANPILRDVKLGWRISARVCSFGAPNVVPGSFLFSGTNFTCKRLDRGDLLIGHIVNDEAGRISELTVYWKEDKTSGIKVDLRYEGRFGEDWSWMPSGMALSSINGSFAKRINDLILDDVALISNSSAKKMVDAANHVTGRDVSLMVYSNAMAYLVGRDGAMVAATNRLLADRDVSGDVKSVKRSRFRPFFVPIMAALVLSLPLLRLMKDKERNKK